MSMTGPDCSCGTSCGRQAGPVAVAPNAAKEHRTSTEEMASCNSRNASGLQAGAGLRLLDSLVTFHETGVSYCWVGYRQKTVCAERCFVWVKNACTQILAFMGELCQI